MEGTSALCVLSGGMDSTTLLYHLLSRGEIDHVEAISFDYGQRHRKELDYAKITCVRLDVPHMVVTLPDVEKLLMGSALTDFQIKVPEGHYEDESMKATVVPNRNMMLLSIAGSYAVGKEFDVIATAVHAGDHAIYPDCRPEFIEAMRTAFRVGNYHPVGVYAPYLDYTKADIAVEGLILGIDYDKETWSCYKGGATPCKVCGTCVEREEALREARQYLSQVTPLTFKQKDANE